MGWLDDWGDIIEDIDGPGYPENDYRGGESIVRLWGLSYSGGCGVALGCACFIPWLTLSLAVFSICVFIWEIDRRVCICFFFIID